MRTRLIRTLFAWALALICWNGASPVFSAQAGDTGTALIEHLDHVISWYRTVASLVQSTPALGAIPARDDVAQQSLAALQNAFDYARSQAATLSPGEQAGSQTAPPGTSRHGLQQAYAAAGQRISGMQDQMKAVAAAMEKARGKKLAGLVSQRDGLASALKLNQDLQATLQKLIDFMNNSGEPGATEITGRIDDLQQTVPELRGSSSKGKNTPGNTDNFHADSAGILSLGIDIFGLMRGRVQLDAEAKATEALLIEVTGLKKPFIKRIRNLVQQAQQLSTAPEQQGDVSGHQQTRQQLKNLQQEFTRTSSVIVPLSKEGLLLESTRGNLAEWSSALERSYLTSLRYLLLRFAEIGVVIALILILSEVWRRLTFRYVREARLRRQMLLVRRITMGFAISLAVVLSFVTEFGSIATFAGFITAGIAVALQNVILSVVAYFFLIGRYGVRTGDRVTITGVTGEVVEVGLVRIYLMELAGGGTDRRPTGRIVVFSNSVLFQPSAFFKQLPGTEYAWHTVSMVLAPDADHEAAEQRLMAAVNEVYGRYRSVIERQHIAFEHAVNLQVAEPAPERYVKYTDAGLEFAMRYPVEISRAAEIDEQMMRNLLTTINQEPKIRFAGAPRIETAV